MNILMKYILALKTFENLFQLFAKRQNSDICEYFEIEFSRNEVYYFTCKMYGFCENLLISFSLVKNLITR